MYFGEDGEPIMLRFMISDNSLNTKEQFNKVKELMNNVGISMTYDDENHCLRIMVDLDMYERTVKRNAGRRKIIAMERDNEEIRFFHYSDIIYMLQNMKDPEIIERCGVSRSTYFRHKKKMMQSTYYKSLDQTKLNDLEYLKEVPYDRYF